MYKEGSFRSTTKDRVMADLIYQQVDFPSGKSYTVKKVLGEGGFGIVFLGQRTGLSGNDPAQFERLALKTDLKAYKYEDTVAAESERLKLLAHPHVIKLLDSGGKAYGKAQETYKYQFIAIELASEGSIWEYIKHRKPDGLPDQEALLYMRQMTSAINYMHVNGWVHRDVKLMNVLLVRDKTTGQLVAKMSDLGGSTQGKGPCLVHRTWGTLVYAPPEMRGMTNEGGVFADFTVDVWALGICLFEMVLGKRHAFSFGEFGKRYRARLKEAQQLKFMDSQIGAFVVSVMQFNPNKRPTTYEMLMDPIFAETPNDPAPIIYPGLEDQLLANVGKRTCPDEFPTRGTITSPLKTLTDFARGLFVDVFGFFDASSQETEEEAGIAKRVKISETAAPFADEEPVDVLDFPTGLHSDILDPTRKFVIEIDKWIDIRTNLLPFTIQSARDKGSLAYAEDIADLADKVLARLNL